MHEDRLSPQLGRLIDAAKAEAALADPALSRPEGVAVLTAEGAVHACHGGRDAKGPASCAGEAALASARAAGAGEVLAAAVAVADDPAESVFPCAETLRSLREIDADLPVIVKQLGRWVMVPLSRLTPPV